MARHLQHEMENLKERVLNLCATVERNVSLATRAIEERDEDAAYQVIRGDVDVDRAEVAIEEECLKILALHQPVAIDLRVLIAILKINNDLERIGDLAVNIAERALVLARNPVGPERFDFAAMAEKVTAMLRMSLDALVRLDVDLAYRVCAADDEVDRLHRGMYDLVERQMAAGTCPFHALTQQISVSRYLERIADHATNIAEDAIYMISGEIVRHRTEDHADAAATDAAPAAANPKGADDAKEAHPGGRG